MRTIGNSAAHNPADDHAEALSIVRTARKLGIWFCRAFEDGHRNPGQFVRPTDPATFGSVVGPGKRRTSKLTEHQFAVLDGLADHNRAAIHGGAGTGKTVLALEKAQRLAGRGAETLLICYSQALGAALSGAGTQLDLPNLRVHTYNDYAETVCRSAGVNISLSPSRNEDGECPVDRRK